jgi:hypothetical protein
MCPEPPSKEATTHLKKAITKRRKEKEYGFNKINSFNFPFVTTVFVGGIIIRVVVFNFGDFVLIVFVEWYVRTNLILIFCGGTIIMFQFVQTS